MAEMLRDWATRGAESRARFAVGRLRGWFTLTELSRGMTSAGGLQLDYTYAEIRAALDRLVADGTIVEPEHGTFAKPGTPPRYLAVFRPQAWIEDEAVDIDSPTARWDVTSVLSTFERAYIDDELRHGEVFVHADDEAQRLLAALDQGNSVHVHARIHPYSVVIERQESVNPEAPHRGVAEDAPGKEPA